MLTLCTFCLICILRQPQHNCKKTGFFIFSLICYFTCKVLSNFRLLVTLKFITSDINCSFQTDFGAGEESKTWSWMKTTAPSTWYSGRTTSSGRYLSLPLEQLMPLVRKKSLPNGPQKHNYPIIHQKNVHANLKYLGPYNTHKKHLRINSSQY